MSYPLDSKTPINIRKGMQVMTRPWSQIAFEFMGVKEAKTQGEKLSRDGITEWEGFVLFHPNHKDY